MKRGFAAKYRDPRWQRLRMQVLTERGWTCEDCGATDRTLHVHHGYYEYGRDPWEYLPSTLWVLCEDCHAEAGALLKDAKALLGHVRPRDLELLVAFLHEFSNEDHVRRDTARRSAAAAMGVEDDDAA